MPIPLHVLLVEDSEDDALLIYRALQKGGFEPKHLRVETAAQMAGALHDRRWDIILCDFKLPQFDGFGAISVLKETGLDIPILIVSGTIGEEMAVECMRRGASDYIMKDNLSRLCPAIQRELAEAQSRAKRLLAEEALQKSEEKFKTIANYTVDWESWFAPDGTYLWVNPAVERLTGFSADEVLSMTDFIEVMIAEEDRKAFREYFKSALTGTRGENLEIRYAHKNGSILWLSVSWQPVYDAEDKFIGIRTSGRDVTARKQDEELRRNLEKQLFESQKMEAIGTLAGGIAHDFNNILSGIIGYAELASMQTDKALLNQNIRQILKAAERARNLVKQILAFSRHVEQDKKPMDFKGVVQEAMRLLRATIPTTIEMRLSLINRPVIISADSTQVHQVLMNICTNAVHAMGEKGGTLAVELTEEEIHAGYLSREINLAPGCYAKLSISDTGHGIDPVHINRLFDPFFTTKKIGEGTGLGLAVVYGIVQDHGGIVKVASRVDKGTTFDVYLPVLADQTITPPVPEKEALPRGTESILFVDDEPDLADLGQNILSALGYKVSAYANSREALHVYQKNPKAFDLVVTDMNMPLLSGSDLAAEILKIRRDQPIVVMTGYSDYMDSDRAVKMGIRAFALKPLTRSMMATLVRKALDDK
jgi:PAS domain S-box-containing protein